jgi:AcrR family transcriptional regulator
VRRTRVLLQDAMRSLILEKNYNSISVQDVTERATVNRATFYAHYPDKQALLSSVIKADFQSFMHQRFGEDRGCFGPESLEKLVAGIFDFMGSRLDGCPETVKDSIHVLTTALLEELHDLFLHWLEEGRPPAFDGHSPEMVATMLSWSVYGAALKWSRGKRKRSPDEVAKSVVALLTPAALVAA